MIGPDEVRSTRISTPGGHPVARPRFATPPDATRAERLLDDPAARCRDVAGGADRARPARATSAVLVAHDGHRRRAVQRQQAWRPRRLRRLAGRPARAGCPCREADLWRRHVSRPQHRGRRRRCPRQCRRPRFQPQRAVQQLGRARGIAARASRVQPCPDLRSVAPVEGFGRGGRRRGCERRRCGRAVGRAPNVPVHRPDRVSRRRRAWRPVRAGRATARCSPT